MRRLTWLCLLLCLPTWASAQVSSTRIRDGVQPGEADVLGSTPAGTEQGLVTRPIPGSAHWPVDASQAGTWTVQQGTPPWSVSQSGSWTVEQGTPPWQIRLRDASGTDLAIVGADGSLKVDNSSHTQPVSGTVTANQGGAPWAIRLQDASGSTQVVVTGAGALKVDGSAVTQPVSIAGTVTVSGTVTANAGTNLNTSALALEATLGRAQASTTSGQTGPLVQGAVTTAAPTYTTGQTDPLSLQTDGALRTAVTNTVTVDGSGVTQPVSAASLPLPTGAATEATLSTLNGKVTAVDTGAVTIAALPNEGQQTMANSISVAVASNQSAVPVSGPLTDTQLRATAVPVDGSGVTQPVSGTVSINALPTGSNTIGSVKVTDGTDTAQVTATNGGSLQVECAAGCGAPPSFTDDSTFTPGSDTVAPVAGTYRATRSALTDGNAGAVALNAKRGLFVTLEDAASNELASATSQPAGTERGLVVRPASGAPDITASATITASGQTQQITTGGRPSVSFTDVSDTFNGTVVFDVSSDGGTTWQSISVWDRTYSTFRTSVSTSPSRVGVSYVVTDLAGVSHVRIRSTSGSSGTLTGEFRATMGRVLIDRVQILGGTLDSLPALTDVTGGTSFTASGQTASFAVTGRGSMGWTVTANTFDGNVITEASVDGGTTWSPIEIYDRTNAVYTTAALTSASLTAGNSFAVVDMNGVSHVRLRTTSGSTGTLSFATRMTASANGPPPRSALKITDGTDIAQVTTTAGGSLQVECSTGCGGGTQYDQGTATTATDKLSMAGAVRHDTATVDGGVADGDRVTLSTDASGRLRTTAADTTQPISGSLTNISGTISLPTGASTLAEQQTQTTSLQLIDDVVHSNDAALGKVAAVGCQFDDTSPGTTTENNVRAVRCSTRREVYGQIRDAAGNERGANVNAAGELTVSAAVTSVPSNQSVNLAQVGGATVNTGNGAASGSQRVTLANDSTGIVQEVPGTSGGLSISRTVAAGSTNATNVKASAGQVYAMSITNENAALRWVHLYNTSGTPSCGSSIIASFGVPGASAGAGSNVNINVGLAFGTGIGFCITTTRDGTGSVTANDVTLNVFYK